MIVADTDVLIDFLRGAEPVAKRIALELTMGSIATTAVTAFELEAGALGARQKLAVDDLLAALHVFPLGGSGGGAVGPATRRARIARHRGAIAARDVEGKMAPDVGNDVTRSGPSRDVEQQMTLPSKRRRHPNPRIA